MRLGIDIGRVIIGPTIFGIDDTSFIGTTVEEAMTSKPAEQALEVIAHLVERFENNVWLVSKCGPSVQRKTLLWLDHWRFYELTGLPRDHIRFCLKRPQKRLHTDELMITHFIDDRVDVLEHLRGGVDHLYLFGEQKSRAPHWTTAMPSWREAEALIASSNSSED